MFKSEYFLSALCILHKKHRGLRFISSKFGLRMKTPRKMTLFADCSSSLPSLSLLTLVFLRFVHPKAQHWVSSFVDYCAMKNVLGPRNMAPIEFRGLQKRSHQNNRLLFPVSF